MKKSILLAATTLALILGLTGCPKEVGSINWKGGALGSGDGTKTYKVNQTNEEDYVIRGMKPFGAIKRAGSTCIVQMFNQTSNNYDGVVGFMTYVTKDTLNNTYNFLVVGVTNKKGKIRTYASYYCNISPENLNGDNFGVPKSSVKTQFDKTCTTPYEVVILDWFDLEKASIADGTVRVAIDFEGKKDGTIAINWYSVPKMPDSGDQASATYDFAKNGIALRDTVIATRDHLGTEDGNAKNGWIYAYANIYADKTLNGQWDLFNETMIQAAAYAYEEEPSIPFEVGDIIFE